MSVWVLSRFVGLLPPSETYFRGQIGTLNYVNGCMLFLSFAVALVQGVTLPLACGSWDRLQQTPSKVWEQLNRKLMHE